MRQPLFLRATGMLHTVTVALSPATLLKEGGWLFFTLDPGSDYAAQAAASPGYLKVVATRVPPLAGPRPVFTPVLFPVSKTAAEAAALGNFDEVFVEAATFDDGFAKIVHGSQPLGADPLDEDGRGMPPLKDEGIQLAWDDETVLLGQNRHVGLNPDGTPPPDAPRGIAGYRIDVRTGPTDRWHTLTRVHAAGLTYGAPLGPFEGELRVEVHPSRLEDQFWLPAFFTRWKGGSLVLQDPVEQILLGLAASAPSSFLPVDAGEVPLRYGRHYQFRVRMVDTSGGGPALDEEPVNPGEAPVAPVHFKRQVPPGPIRIEPVGTASLGHPVTQYTVKRPGIAFPQAVFTGVSNALARLKAIHDANVAAADLAQMRSVEIPDPDVARLEIRVLVRAPAFDPAGEEDGFFELYTTWRDFPADHEAALALEFHLEDCRRLSELALSTQTGAPGTASGAVPLPSARDVRIELRAVGRNDLVYFGSDRARRGKAHILDLHAHAAAEASFFRPGLPQQRIRSVFLRPDSVAEGATIFGVSVQNRSSPVLAKRLAGAVDLIENNGTLHAQPGRRVVFGCSGLNHQLPPDASGLELTVFDELPEQWITVLQLELDRDWTWKGYADPSFEVWRTMRLLPAGTAVETRVATIQMIHSVNHQAADGPDPDRDRILLVHLDAFVPPLEAGLPYEIEVSYTIKARFENGEQAMTTCQNRLPVTTPPTQLPKVVAAGYASSPYLANEFYSATAPRRRMLWLEFEEAPRDQRDTYFVRDLAHAPDPMLLAMTEPMADPPAYAKPAVDPELVRVITPGQSDDFAGLSVMQRLERAAGSDRHYLVPLPPNLSPESPELLGFYTYEIRVGHDRGTEAAPFWSTAQGRYGPAFVIEGVQHPAPPITCGTSRNKAWLIVSADFAQPFLNGRNLVPDPPNTQLWAVLYVQIYQADGASRRNIQLDVRPIRLLSRDEATSLQLPVYSDPAGMQRQTVGFAWWAETELTARLNSLGLPADSPLSVLAVEVLPEPNTPFADPLGSQLGEVRILRTSPLSAVSDLCC
jgi:hypothetical protein